MMHGHMSFAGLLFLFSYLTLFFSARKKREIVSPFISVLWSHDLFRSRCIGLYQREVQSFLCQRRKLPRRYHYYPWQQEDRVTFDAVILTTSSGTKKNFRVVTPIKGKKFSLLSSLRLFFQNQNLESFTINVMSLLLQEFFALQYFWFFGTKGVLLSGYRFFFPFTNQRTHIAPQAKMTENRTLDP